MKKLILLLICAQVAMKSYSAETKIFDAWSLICGDAGNCSVSQLVAKDPQGKNVVMGVNVNFSVSDHFPVLLLRMPPGLHTDSGVGIKIDDNKAIQVKISQCNVAACQSVVKIDEVMFKELMEGKAAKVAVALKQGRQLTLPVSLSGFKDAYKALLVKHQKRLAASI